MGIDMSTAVYLPNFDAFARPVVFSPIVSRPGGGVYTGRGIFGTQDVGVPGEDGSIISDQVTILDIREREFSILPRQRDRLTIPVDGDTPEEGVFEIVDTSTNGGGETTLIIRKIEPPIP
jgi:hypothetical protein